MRHLLFICVLLGPLINCAPALALDRYQVESYSLANGLQVVLKPGYGQDHVAIRLVVGVGFDDFSCDRQELPHLLEHLFFSGLDKRGEGELEERMQALGGDWNAYTSDSDTTFVIEVPAKNQRKALDLLLALMTQPPFDEQAIDASKRIVAHEDGGHNLHLQRVLDHDGIGGHDANSQLAVELGLECAGQGSVDRLTAHDLKKVRKDWYAPNNMSLIVVGDLDTQLAAYVQRTYGRLQAIDPNEHLPLREINHSAEPRRNLTTRWLDPSASLHWIFVQPQLDDKTGETWELLNDYLNWQLYKDLRLEHGLSYGPWAEQAAFGSESFLSLNADVERDDLEKTETVMRQMVQRLRKEGLNPEAFRRLQNAAVARQAWAVQGDSALADFYWQASSDMDGSHLANQAQELQAVTLEQANSALRKLFAEPGYVRIERSLLEPSDLYEIVGCVLAVLAIVFLYRHRNWKPGQRRKASSRD